MATLTLAERKQRIAEKMARDKARLRSLEATERGAHRKRETRAKILVGAAFLDHVAKHPEERGQVDAILQRLIVKERDIEVLRAFGFMQGKP